jgi:hypothetical protein
VSPNYQWILNEIRCIISQKTDIFIITVVRISNPPSEIALMTTKLLTDMKGDYTGGG